MVRERRTAGALPTRAGSTTPAGEATRNRLPGAGIVPERQDATTNRVPSGGAVPRSVIDALATVGVHA